jgi:hypothetical protein
VPLKLDALYRQVEEMVTGLPGAFPRQQLAEAQAFMRRADPDVLRQKLRQRKGKRARIPWLVADPVNTLAQTFPVPTPPSNLSVVAADGSTIPPDRHSPVQYYVLNVGYAVLKYGEVPDAILDAQGQFCFDEEDLYFDPQGKRIPIEGTRLGIHMAISEMAGLLDATRFASDPMVALSDGSLILWNLQSEDEELQAQYMARFLDALDAFARARIPVASYISYPGGQDIVNSLRLMLCDVEVGGCKSCPQGTKEQVLCRFMGSIWDRSLFQGLLQPGARSDVFASQSAILSRYREHHIHFFYLDVGGEVARVEAPQWVMADPAMLGLVHGAIYDQCQRSSQYPPYPPVLIEAHEQAVISTGERQVVQELIERALAGSGVFYVRSAKDRSKRNRGV